MVEWPKEMPEEKSHEADPKKTLKLPRQYTTCLGKNELDALYRHAFARQRVLRRNYRRSQNRRLNMHGC